MVACVKIRPEISFPPGGWQFLQPETGFKAPHPGYENRFKTAKTIAAHRRSNPHKFTDFSETKALADLETFTWHRLRGDPKYCIVPATAQPETSPAEKKSPGVMARIARLAGAVKTFRSWIGDGMEPVSYAQAQSRANVCEGCPLNHKGDVLNRIAGTVAGAIKDQMQVKQHLHLEILNEDKLGTCAACECHLPLKVWVPLENIPFDEELEARLDPGCWILAEKKTLDVAMAVHAGDLTLAIGLLKWIERLGPVNASLTLIVDRDIPERVKLREAANSAFTKVKWVDCGPFFVGWPEAANQMFYAACSHAENPFLWLEPDCVPLRAGWLTALSDAYAKSGKAIMGAFVKSKSPGLPKVSVAGVAVYPAEPIAVIGNFLESNKAWDVECAARMVEFGRETKLIQHFWGKKELSPTFRRLRSKDNPPNTLLLDCISPEAVLFHRCKDGTLIDLLKEQTPRIFHACERHWQADEQSEQRIGRALHSWVRLPGVHMAHLWKYPRTSAAVGDARNLPYLKDILAAAMARADNSDIIMLTNDDTILHPAIVPLLKTRIVNTPLSSFRLNFKTGNAIPIDKPVADYGSKSKDLGRDLFAFTKRWLTEHWENIPDFLLGELEWDLVLAILIRQFHGVESTTANLNYVQLACELPLGYVWHEIHARKWNSSATETSPAKSWNRQLAMRWCELNGVDYPILSDPDPI